jgi:uncharacterized membrane protein (UPF0182 family)
MPIRLIVALIALLLLLITLPTFAELYTDWLWFDEMGYGSVFVKSLVSKGLLGVSVFVVAFLALLGNFRTALRGQTRPYMVFPGAGDLQPLVLERHHLTLAAAGLAGALSLFIAGIASSQWLVAWQFLNATPFGETDALFGRDVAFYVFTLPFLDSTRYLALAIVALSFIGSTAAYVIGGEVGVTPTGLHTGGRARAHLALLIAAGFLLLAWGAFLDMPRTLLTPAGIVHGASYVDVAARLPILRILMVAGVLGAGAAVYAAISATMWPVALAVGGYLIVTVGGGGVAALLQQLVVIPDEQQREAPFIAHNIKATRLAFDLDEVEELQVSGDATLTLDDIVDNAETINNVRLWDHLPLLDTFSQIQEIRTYYEFASVDNDRYVIDGNYRQTMVSARELNSDSLPNRSWVNERLQYTHGFGVALGPVNQVTEEGLPVLFIGDLPPRSETDLVIEEPSIYFGELSNDYVIVNTETDEFHYPEGDDNVSSRYDGTGGVELGGLLRRLLFSLRLRSYEVLVSSQLSADSRVLYHRNIADRLATIAPFLQYDADPYLVIAAGRLFWMRDAYTVTGNYPYSSPVSSGVNYIRNSVKVVVDAYNGTTTFYLAEPDDPIAVTIGKIFPDLLQPLETMPEELKSHIRYPEGIFTLQTEMYSTFHMTNPSVFYNREDQWEVPVIDSEQMEPYYTIMRLPGEEKAEFIQMLPFTPRGKNNLAAWMVARSDGDNYGRVLVFQFPKQKVVFGPAQVVARMSQDQEISPQITLWNQQGSEVIHGTLLVIPIEEALLYIRPLYLRASGGRIPELNRIVVGYQNQIVMERTLDEALARLFGGSPTGVPRIGEGLEPTLVASDPETSGGEPALEFTEESAGLGDEAQQHYASAMRAQRDGDWARYGEEIERLGAILEQLRGAGGGQE